MILSTVVLVLTALWHLAAAWHFTLFPERTLARTTEERPVNRLAAELFRFLGGMNVGFVVLALVACGLGPDARFVAAIALAVANASQAVQDVRVSRLGMARGPFFVQILVGDLLFTGLNIAAAFAVAGLPA